jgi:hypothetical protein
MHFAYHPHRSAISLAWSESAGRRSRRAAARPPGSGAAARKEPRMKFSGAEGEAEVLRRPTASELTPIERLLTQSDGLSLMDERPTPKRWRPDKFSLFFGVILPVFAIAIELLAQWCANAVFDPLPGVWHSILVCCVPHVNFWVWHRLRRDEPRVISLTRLACGAAIGIAVFLRSFFFPSFRLESSHSSSAGLDFYRSRLPLHSSLRCVWPGICDRQPLLRACRREWECTGGR